MSARAAPSGAGSDDLVADLSAKDTATAEEAFTSGRFDLHVFPGGHFYLMAQCAAVPKALLAGH